MTNFELVEIYDSTIELPISTDVICPICGEVVKEDIDPEIINEDDVLDIHSCFDPITSRGEYKSLSGNWYQKIS